MEQDRGHSVVFLIDTLNSHSISLQWVPANLMLGVFLWKTSIPFRDTCSQYAAKTNYWPVSWVRSSFLHTRATNFWRDGPHSVCASHAMRGKDGYPGNIFQAFPQIEHCYLFFQSIFKAIKSDKSDSEQWPLHKLTLYVGVPAEKATKGLDTR